MAQWRPSALARGTEAAPSPLPRKSRSGQTLRDTEAAPSPLPRKSCGAKATQAPSRAPSAQAKVGEEVPNSAAEGESAEGRWPSGQDPQN